MSDSIFTKIIKGEIPCQKVYEDDKTIAIMDIHPEAPGHVLVVPKIQIDHFDDLPDDYYQAVWATVRKIAKAQKKSFKPARVGLKVVGLDVPHVHIHVLPFSTEQEFRSIPDTSLEPDYKLLEIHARKIAENIEM